MPAQVLVIGDVGLGPGPPVDPDHLRPAEEGSDETAAEKAGAPGDDDPRQSAHDCILSCPGEWRPHAAPSAACCCSAASSLILKTTRSNRLPITP